MSEKTLEFVKMIAAGENVQAETAFDAMMLARVGSRVEQEKPTVAAGMFAVKEEVIAEDDMDLWAPDKKKKKKKKHGLGGGDGKIWDTKKTKPSAIGGGSDRKIWEK